MLRAGLIALVLAVGLAGSAPAQQPDRNMPATDRAACVAKGGTVKRMGMMGIEGCELRYKDAGKVCTAKKQCSGQCLYQGDPAKPPRRPKGVCQPTDNGFGCYAFIDNKNRVSSICVD